MMINPLLREGFFSICFIFIHSSKASRPKCIAPWVEKKDIEENPLASIHGNYSIK